MNRASFSNNMPHESPKDTC